MCGHCVEEYIVNMPWRPFGSAITPLVSIGLAATLAILKLPDTVAYESFIAADVSPLEMLT